jgi:spore germination cell wall hydrolase CwlJ-like protein
MLVIISFIVGYKIAQEESEKYITNVEKQLDLVEMRLVSANSQVLKQKRVIDKQNDTIFDLKSDLANTRYVLHHTWDYRLMCKLVQCEAGGEDDLTQLKVASVIFNRVKSDKFPDTIMDVMVAQNQFTPIGNGNAYEAEASDEVIQAVDKAILDDYADGALFFIDYDSMANTEYYDNDLQFLSRGTNGMRFYTLKE